MHSEINRGLTAIGSNTEALLCQALTAELRRLAVDPEACGNTLAWLLAQLLPDQRLDLDDVVGRIGGALVGPGPTALWDYGRAARRGVSRA
ncbi:hypothetical protein [Elioraea sp.]|uniref:hypothetical protein n=1 Tax=Elioraea sp. TaxID=2185103 RepID=UPI0025BC2A7E|nr:hypothetical protein [Elioraea sp.]